MHKYSAVIFLMGASWLACFPGCAIASKGLRQEVGITSAPAGAAVLVDGQPAGHTPLVVNLSRRHSHRVELSKDGYAPAHAELNPVANEYARRTVRFGLDIDSGASNDLVPARVDLALVPVGANAPPGDGFEQMKAAVDETDRLLHDGMITAEEHHQRIEKILARFAPAP
jgi:PEGA domain